MKQLLSSILIAMAISSASYAAVTKTEIIEEEVCPAVAGCSLDTKTGECPDCIIVTRKVVTEVKEPVIIEIDESVVEVKPIEKTEVVVTVKKTDSFNSQYRRASFKDIKRWKKAKNRGWTCVVGPCDFIDKNGNLKG